MTGSLDDGEMKPTFDPDRKDWFLAHLITTYVNAGLEIGVTVSTGGLIVSGSLISGKTYLAEFGSAFADAVKNSSVSNIAEMVKTDIASISEIVYQIDQDNTKAKQPPGYLHLRRAKLIRADKPISLPLWRVRLSAVDGFTFGDLAFP